MCARLATGEPAAQKSAGPARHGAVVPEPTFDMAMTGTGAGLAHPLAGQEHPAAHSRESHFRMELEAVGLVAIAEGLCLEILARGEQGRPARKIETFPVPLVH